MAVIIPEDILTFPKVDTPETLSEDILMSSDRVTVAIPLEPVDAEALRFGLTKLIFIILSGVPTRVPSS